jgi:hypothetical protein
VFKDDKAKVRRHLLAGNEAGKRGIPQTNRPRLASGSKAESNITISARIYYLLAVAVGFLLRSAKHSIM